jgi:hypothetical protein
MPFQRGDDFASVAPDHINNHRQNEAKQRKRESDC